MSDTRMTARAHRIPILPGGPLDLLTIWGLYRTYRKYHDLRRPKTRWRTLLAAARTDLAAWRYSRALQRGEVAR